MIRSLYTVNRNMNILQKKQENNSANIANVNTPGYKFQDIVQSTLEPSVMVNYAGGREMNQRRQLGDFVFGNQIDEVYRNFEQGNLSQSDRDTDLAIVGNGFFTVEMNNGQVAFTRNGNFRINDQNELVTMEGYRVMGVNDNGQTSYITVNNDNLNVDNTGRIAGQNLSILISDFADYTNLNNIGSTLFISEQGQNIIQGELRQGYLEMSNVKVADEMVKMIQISREFESNQKLLHTADSTLSKAVNEIGRV
ncbi:flagellar hook-basal body complex protein [Alkalibaculum sp. M08DMB]|uniref:Flagellar hook-basal body complex protein n=1 Tax=Alkalibaculum sporogenes TaxID=2655001 RepID=A0A6A7K614_9FIRM|nr:flagellar hook-basal body complex protein [Alkalibaculum sporogenes]MPW24815.1 flagellar hook-basal body complex protein [Alkalibaculum sporogenes]